MTDTAPMPYGKILPDLRGCTYPNIPEPQYLDKMLCPNCGSDNVVGVNPVFNPDECYDIYLGRPTEGLWFCISCRDSWRYELDK